MTIGEIIVLAMQLAIGGILVWWLRASRSISAKEKSLMEERIGLHKDQVDSLTPYVEIIEKAAEARVRELQVQVGQKEKLDVLVIDDEEGPRDSLRMILKENHRIRTAVSGGEGLEMIKEERPDLVLLDIRMPGMDGIEVMQEIKQFDANIEVAIITAYAAFESAQDAVRYGALDYLSKPFGVEEVMSVANRALQRKLKRQERERELREHATLLAELDKVNETLRRGLAEVDIQLSTRDETIQAMEAKLDEFSCQFAASQQAPSVPPRTPTPPATEYPRERAERLMALGEIAAGTVHDVQNLLGGILVRTQLLLIDCSDPDVRDGLQDIERAALDVEEAVSRIMRYGTREDGEQEFVPIDLNELLTEVIKATRYRWSDGPQREGKHIELEKHLSPASSIEGNPSELRQLFVNIITNACDAMPDGGKITISTECSATAVSVTIADTGDGMPPEVQERIFDAFFTTKGEGHLGLGLAVGKKAVQRHGGQITVNSSVGEGAVFTVTLPRSDQLRPPIPETPAACL